MRSCYLCRRNAAENISLHKFPKRLQLSKKWIEACGLHEKDDVSHLFICSSHFRLPRDLFPKERLPPGAVPTLGIPNNAVVNATSSSEIASLHYRAKQLDSPSTVDSQSISKVYPKYPKVKVTSLTVSKVTEYDSAVQRVSEASTIHAVDVASSPEIALLHHRANRSSNLPTVENKSMSKSSQVAEYDDAVQQVSEVSTSRLDYISEENCFSRTKRLFAEPRYVSEITTSDVDTPRKAKRVLEFVKKVDKKKCKRIKCLQNQKRRLLKQIAALQTLVSHLKERRLVIISRAVEKLSTKTNESTKLRISTYIVDNTKGLPISGLQVGLYKLMDGEWTFLNECNTNMKGLFINPLGKMDCTIGRYKLRFDVDKYFTLRRIETMIPFIEFIFDVKNVNSHYHVLLLLSPFSYTIYGGT
ncbi:uncharacterized protein LOC105275792 isoform X3 [Ooceraea biroi]|uniref:uncharacterized protein LOC105275792 isoform X3 n=1 Tax=Ooceraea biroi TaxID=2015173 RepID=UPI000F07C7E0|nr:uncharacterized protein LOC105275792 isoform X3 [Ooceraea biroi]